MTYLNRFILHPPRPVNRLRAAIALLLVFLFLPVGLSAQPENPMPIRPMFGIGDNEFLTGAWMKIKPGNTTWSYRKMIDSMGYLWTLCDSLGIKVIRYQMDEVPEIMTSLARARRRPEHRLITAHGLWNMDDAFRTGAYGREVVLYPFNTANISHDSVQFPTWPMMLTTLRGGEMRRNPLEVDNWNQPAAEQQYLRGNTAPGTVIGEGLAFNRFPQQTGRWPTYKSWGRWNVDYSDTILTTDHFLGYGSWHYFPNTTQYVTVTGHLFEKDGRGDTGRNLLRIDIYHEIPGGHRYFASTTGPNRYVEADENIERLVATLYLRRADLLPRSVSEPWGKYQEISIPWDARLSGGIPGPLYSDSLGSNQSQRLNMKITWLGGDLALRSIALRDSVGELVLGRTAASSRFRARALSAARYSYGDTITDTTYRWPVIARSTNVEQFPIHANAFNRINKLLRENIIAYDSINRRVDSLYAWTEVLYTRELFTRHDDPASSMPAVVVEQGAGMEDWLRKAWGSPPRGILPNEGKIPSIRLHNGGRWEQPELTIDPFDIEHRYETILQFSGFKLNSPKKLPEVYERFGVLALGRAAEVARDQGRRLVVVPFCVGTILLNAPIKDVPQRGAVSVSHFPEPAEMRVQAHLALCYGARGLLWQQLQGHHNFYKQKAVDEKGTFTWGYNEDFGVTSPFTDGAGGVGGDRYYPFRIGGDADADGGFYRDTANAFELDSFYTGWIQRSTAMKKIHRRIEELWPELSQLRWRSGYSIHFTDTLRFPYSAAPIPSRPIAPEEIVSSIRTRHPRSGLYDSTHRTFVELGIFYPKRGAGADSLRETNHIYLVNRRCFERTDDIPATSEMGRRMDTLAEVRTLDVRLNLRHPIDSSSALRRYTYVRVREIAPEGDTLPLTHAPRRGLDTVIHRDSIFSITLGPGRAALLRITYLTGEPPAINEVLEPIGRASSAHVSSAAILAFAPFRSSVLSGLYPESPTHPESQAHSESPTHPENPAHCETPLRTEP